MATNTKNAEPISLNGKKYNIILCDAPWEYEGFSDSKHGAAKAHYPSMSYEELAALPVAELADKNCVLFMWATYPKLKESIALLEAWSFRYVTVAFTWIKLNPKGNGLFRGVGFHTASNAEIVLLGKKGTLKRQEFEAQVIESRVDEFEGEEVIRSRVRKHSQKPDEVYTRIERLYGDVPRIELFARERRDRWSAWGNQLSTQIQRRLPPQQLLIQDDEKMQ